MPYITRADLLTRDSERDLINLTDPAGLAIIDSVIDQAILYAQAEVDSYIGGRVRLPLADAEVSQPIKLYTLTIARYFLYADRKTEAVTTEYENALRWLRDVSAGKASTGVVQAADTNDTATGATIFAPVRKPVFGETFEGLYDVELGPNGSGEVGIG
jgi:phage gp36-like protein